VLCRLYEEHIRSEAGVELRYRRLVRSYSQLSAQNRALLAQANQAQMSDRTADEIFSATRMWSNADAECEQLDRACSDDCDAVGDVTADTAVQSASSSVSSWSTSSAPPSPCASEGGSDLRRCQHLLCADAEETTEHCEVIEAEAAATAAATAAAATAAPAATAVAATAPTGAAATAAAAETAVAPVAAVQSCYQQQHCGSEQQQLHSPKRCISPMRSVSLSWACAWTTAAEPAHTAAVHVLSQPRRSQP
jgi:hypothetical protein